MLWALAAMLAAAVVSRLNYQGPVFSDDAFQYLAAAASAASGGCLCTQVVHFDEQVESSKSPLPFTHFAPAYPVILAAISKTGLSLEAGGYALSFVSHLLSTWLLFELGLILGARPWVAAAFTALWIGNASAVWCSASLTTEALFTALLLGLANILVRAEKSPERQSLLLWAAFVTGLLYWVRYPGLFLIPCTALFLLAQWFRRGRTYWASASLALLAAMAGFVMIRNTALIGSWRGGFPSVGGIPVQTALIEVGKAVYHIVFGDRLPARVDAMFVAFAISAAVVVALSFPAIRTAAANTRWTRARPVIWVGLLVSAYATGIVLAAIQTIASDINRYYLPIYPLALALVAALLSAGSFALPRAIALLALLGAVLAIHGRGFLVPPPTEPHVLVRDLLKQPAGNAETVSDWLSRRVLANEALMAPNGQAIHHLLKLPVISIVPPEASAFRFDEARVRALMTRRRVRYLLVFPGAKIDTQNGVPFLRDAANGRAPDWLTVALDTGGVRALECKSCLEPVSQP